MDERGDWVSKREWIINPGIPMPEGAAAVHGMTTEWLAEHGRKDIRAALVEIWGIILQECVGNRVPIVIYNAPYDLTMLGHELERVGISGYLQYSQIIKTMRVYDPLVIDKELYRYRKGSGMRKLVAVAPIYDVPVEADAHDAGADCLMTGRVLLRQLLLSPSVNNEQQASWKAEQARSLQAWFHSVKAGERQDTSVFINPGWPLQAAEPIEIETERNAAA